MQLAGKKTRAADPERGVSDMARSPEMPTKRRAAKVRIAWVQIAAAIGVTASAVAILNYFDIKPWPHPTPGQKTIDVKSYGQSGGITAGEIHVGQEPRHVTREVVS